LPMFRHGSLRASTDVEATLSNKFCGCFGPRSQIKTNKGA
jgi:hypothetical protein